MGARAPLFFGRSPNEWRRAAMGRGREVAAHARWVDTAPRDCTSIRFGERVRAARRGGHVGSRRHWRPGWPLSLRLRLAAPAAPQTQWRPDAGSGAHLNARSQARALRQHSGSNHEQSRAISSTQEHSVAPRRRPTPSSSERALLSLLPLTALPSSLPPFASPRAC